MKNKSAKAKGKVLEDFVAQKIRESGLDNNAKRQIGSGSGKFKGDISTSINWCIECKNTRSFMWDKTSKQVAREAMGTQNEVIVWHPYGRPLDDSIAILNINDFIELLKRNQEPKIKEPDKEMKWNLIKLKSAINNILKQL